MAGAVAVAAILVLLAAAGAGAAGPVYDWQQTEEKSFTGVDAFTKSQGMASDGGRMFFSWNLGLHSTDLGMDVGLEDNLTGLPLDLTSAGSNHIGDIDFFDGKLYAPVEDGPGYLNPTMVAFDPDTLRAGPERFRLDHDLLTKGVPWVAIDDERGVAYTAQWNDTTLLNVHRLSDFAITSTVQLDRPVPRIQGAEVYKGYLYAARDNYAEKSVIAIDPVTGHVSYLFNRDLGIDHEVEGMTFVTNDQGTTMRLSDIDKSDSNRVDVTSYRIAGDTTPPELTLLRRNESEPLAGRKLDVRTLASEPVTIDATWSRCLGRRPRPCRKTGTPRPAPLVKFTDGPTTLSMPTRTRYAPEGKVLGPGLYRLTLIPVDVADAVGPPVSVTARVRATRP